MGIWNKLFGDKETKEQREFRESREAGERALNTMLGISGKGKVSGGYPVCPKCKSKFPIPVDQIEKQSDGIPLVVCPKCRTRYTVK